MSGFVTAVVGTTVFAYSSYQQTKAIKQAGQAEERRFQAEKKRADVQSVRSIREQVRASRLASGQMVNQGAQSGGMGGSALAGGLSSIASQQQGNIGFMSDIAEQNTAIGIAGLESATAQRNAAIWGVVGQAAATVGTAGLGRFNAGPAPKANAKQQG
jgi:hypothetical protein